jgi:hypothetical protein
MKSFFFLIACFSLITISLNAQNDSTIHSERIIPRKNAIYFEAMGNGALYSINYDRIFLLINEGAVFFRLGGNEYHGISTENLSFNIIGAAGILIGKHYSFFESSLGYTHFLNEPDRLIIFTFGYRLQGRKGLLVRATPMIVFNTQTGNTFHGLWFGLSLGYAF